MNALSHRLHAALAMGCIVLAMGAAAHATTPGPWRPLTDIPDPDRLDGHLYAGPDLLVIAGRGRIDHFAGGAWVTTGRAQLPALFARDESGVGLRGGFVRGPREAYVFGTRQTIVGWDGQRWRIEHGDGPARFRATYTVIDCRGEVQATDETGWLQRKADGTWADLERRKGACRLAPRIKGPPKCWRHSHRPANRIIPCGDAMQVWDETAAVWRTFDAVNPWRRARVPPYGTRLRVPVPDPDISRRVYRWQHDDLLLVAIDRQLYVWTGSGWRLDFEAPHAIGRIFGTGVPHVLLGQTVWRRSGD